MKDQFEEAIADAFKHHPAETALIVTNDGSIFLERSERDAKEHARLNKLEEPMKVTRELFDQVTSGGNSEMAKEVEKQIPLDPGSKEEEPVNTAAEPPVDVEVPVSKKKSK